MQSGEFDSYWTQTETYEALKIYIEMDYHGLREAIAAMLGGGRCRINSRRFQNDMTSLKTKDDVLTLLVHLGYLAYDRKAQEVFIPNQEIASEFMDAVDEPSWDGVIQAIRRSEALLKATLGLDGEAVAKAMDAITQIKEKQYVQVLQEYTGNILLVGINYDKKSKEHQCAIEICRIP